jgi:hypothetical protein
MTDRKVFGFATVDPFEPVELDPARAAAGMYALWRGVGASGERFYLPDQVHAMTATARAKYNDNGFPV